MAQSLKGKRSRTIGVIIPNIFSKFFSESLHSIESKANERGYRTIICFSNDSINKEAECIEKLIKCRVDGIIIAVSKESLYKKVKEHIEKVLTYKIPLVMFDRLEDAIVCDKVGLNETLLAEEATMSLFNLGYRNIAFFSCLPTSSIDESQKEGYLEAMNRKGVRKQILNFASSEFPHQELQKLIYSKKIDAVIVNDETSALLVAKSILKFGFKIPENVHILSLSDMENSEDLSKSFDALDRMGEKQGDVAVDTLIDRIEGILTEEFLKFELKARLSSKKHIDRIQECSI